MTTIDMPAPAPAPAENGPDPRDQGYLVRPGRGGLVDTRVRVDCGYCPAGSRDTECAIHGVAVDPQWWRTPAHLREDGSDFPCDVPALTPYEVAVDAILVRDETAGRWR